MKNVIGFQLPRDENIPAEANTELTVRKPPRPSIVSVEFAGQDTILPYFNDKFDLSIGDLVFVSGELAGCPGRVSKQSFCFKIRLSDYDTVVSVADTSVCGKFYSAGSHWITMDKHALPKEKAMSWFGIEEAEDSICIRHDNTQILLENLNQMEVSKKVWDSAHHQYWDNHVEYLCLDGQNGYAILEDEDRKSFTIEFSFHDGIVENLVCSCFEVGICAHQIAVLIQFQEIWNHIVKNLSREFDSSGYFAAIFRYTIMDYAFSFNSTKSMILCG